MMTPGTCERSADNSNKCAVHGGHFFDNASCNDATKKLYRVTVWGDTADNTFDNLFSDDLYFTTERHSPILVFMMLTDADAIELAQRFDFEVTRAKSDWSI